MKVELLCTTIVGDTDKQPTQKGAVVELLDSVATDYINAGLAKAYTGDKEPDRNVPERVEDQKANPPISTFEKRMPDPKNKMIGTVPRNK